MAATVAEAAVLIKALGVDAVKRDLGRLQGAFANAMRTPAGADKAMEPIRRRIALHAEGLKHESTRAAALAKLEAWEARLNKQLAAGNASYGQRIALEAQLRKIQSVRGDALPPAAVPVAPKKSAGVMGTLGAVGGFARSVAGGLGVGLGFSAAVSGFHRMSEAMDAAEAAQRKLNATSRITGIEMGTITGLATQAEQKFRISASSAADLTAGVVRLTGAAGQVNRSGEFMTAWMDLAAARGLNAAEAMQALETTLIGQDEGLNKLGLANPSGIYDKWAASMGTTAAKMTDAQKQQAILNEVLAVGARVTGEYDARLNSAAGKSDLMAQSSQRMWEALGRAALPLREIALDLGMKFTDWVIRNQEPLLKLGKIIGGTLTVAFGNLWDGIFVGVDAVSSVWNLFVSGIQFGVGTILQAASRLIGGMARLASVVPGMGKLAEQWGNAAGSMGGTATNLLTAANANRSEGLAAAVAIGKRVVGMQQRAAGAFRSTFGTAPAAAGTASAAGMGGTSAPVAPPGSGSGKAGSQTLKPLIGGAAAPIGALPMIDQVRALRPAFHVEPKWTFSFAEFRQQFEARFAAATQASQQFMSAIGGTLLNGFAAGFTALGAGESIGKAVTGALMGGFGQALQAFGTALVTASGIMKVALKAFSSLNPIAMAGAGLAMIALGAFISGAAQRAAGGGGSSGRGGSSGSAPAFGDTRSSLTLGGRAVPPGTASPTLTPRTGAAAAVPSGQAVNVYQTIIGERDPRAQRAIANTVKNARGRNL